MNKRVVGGPSSAAPPAGPYSPSVRIGGLVACSGQAAITSDGDIVTGFAAQVRTTLQNVQRALAASGADLGDVIHVRVYLLSPDQFEEMNAIYAEFFEAPYPARTTVYVGLPDGLEVEIDALAVVSAD